MKRPDTSHAAPGKAPASPIEEELDPAAQTGTFAADEIEEAARTGSFSAADVAAAAREVVEDADHEAPSYVSGGSLSGERSHTEHRVTGIETTFSDLPSPNVETTVSDLPSSDTSFADVHVTGIETTFSDLPIPRSQTTVSGVHRPVVLPNGAGVEVTSSFSEDVSTRLDKASKGNGRGPLLAGLAVAVLAGVAWLGMGGDESTAEPEVAMAAAEAIEEVDAAPAEADVRVDEAAAAAAPAAEDAMEEAQDAPAEAERAEEPVADAQPVEDAPVPAPPKAEKAAPVQTESPSASMAMQRSAAPARASSAGADYTLWFPFNSVSVDDPAGIVERASRCRGDLSVVGHTCDLGAEEANLWISQQRAQAVADALRAQGASVADVSWKGSMEPAAERSGFTVRQASRRVEISCD